MLLDVLGLVNGGGGGNTRAIPDPRPTGRRRSATTFGSASCAARRTQRGFSSAPHPRNPNGVHLAVHPVWVLMVEAATTEYAAYVTDCFE